MAQGWLATQINQGKKDNDIVKSLVGNGWTEEHAKQAIAEARKPTVIDRVPISHILLFAIALAGLFAIAMYLGAWSDVPQSSPAYKGTNHPLFDALVSALALVVAFLFITWAAFDIAIKHHHPRLHRTFYAVASGIVGAGFTAWFLLIVIVFLQWTQFVVYTVVAMALLSIAFGVKVAMTEATYAVLRSHYDNRPRTSTTRMLVISVICAAVCFIILLGVAAVLENMALKEADSKRSMTAGAYDAAIKITKDIGREGSEFYVENNYLREHLTATEIPRPLSSALTLSLHDVATDSFMEKVITYYWQEVEYGLDIGTKANLARQYDLFRNDATASDTQIDLERYATLLDPSRSPEIEGVDFNNLGLLPPTYMGVRLKPLFDINTFGERVTREANMQRTLSKYFPARPNMGDPEQVELVRFRIWLYDQAVVNRG